MIANLKETTLRNQEQDWLKSNLAKFTQMLQGQKDLKTVTQRIFQNWRRWLVPIMEHFIFSSNRMKLKTLHLKLFAAYGYKSDKNISTEFAIGEGLVGQVAFEKERIILSNVLQLY